MKERYDWLLCILVSVFTIEYVHLTLLCIIKV